MLQLPDLPSSSVVAAPATPDASSAVTAVGGFISLPAAVSNYSSTAAVAAVSGFTPTSAVAATCSYTSTSAGAAASGHVSSSAVAAGAAHTASSAIAAAADHARSSTIAAAAGHARSSAIAAVAGHARSLDATAAAAAASRGCTCPICGHHSKDKHCFHYGGVSCYSCRAFFRRAHQVGQAFHLTWGGEGNVHVHFCTICIMLSN